MPRLRTGLRTEAEVVASAGSYYQLNDQISIGSHTDRTAFFVSANGNRSGLGLETLSSEILHESAQAGGSVFGVTSPFGGPIPTPTWRGWHRVTD